MTKKRISARRAVALTAALAAAAFAAMLVSCAGKADAADKPNPTLRAAALKVGAATLTAELARSAEERERGLMFRKSLPDGKGMIFVFDSDQRVSFWMKNTTVPLSIAFIGSDRAIKQIADLEPLSLESVRSERSVRYALEVPRGWFERAGVKVGDRVDMPPSIDLDVG